HAGAGLTCGAARRPADRLGERAGALKSGVRAAPAQEPVLSARLEAAQPGALARGAAAAPDVVVDVRSPARHVRKGPGRVAEGRTQKREGQIVHNGSSGGGGRSYPLGHRQARGRMAYPGAAAATLRPTRAPADLRA